MILNLGNAVFMISISAIIRSGMITISTAASSGFMANAMISAPISIPGALSIILSAIDTVFCRFVTSFVNLVISEPVENLSMLANENFCTFSNKSCLRSAAKFTEALIAKNAPITPPSIISRAVTTISAPIPII